jgi:hypothetical protein
MRMLLDRDTECSVLDQEAALRERVAHLEAEVKNTWSEMQAEAIDMGGVLFLSLLGDRKSGDEE